jgi:hypothetical protein
MRRYVQHLCAEIFATATSAAHLVGCAHIQHAHITNLEYPYALLAMS